MNQLKALLVVDKDECRILVRDGSGTHTHTLMDISPWSDRLLARPRSSGQAEPRLQLRLSWKVGFGIGTQEKPKASALSTRDTCGSISRDSVCV